jgi:flagellar export protein FliJ
MSDDYDLQVLLELRENERDESEQRYADEMQELERRKSYLADVREQLEAAVEERQSERARLDDRRSAGDASLAELAQFERYVKGLRADERDLRDEVERAEASVDEQRQRVEEAREALAEAMRELKAVERHREEWEQERAMEEKRRKASEMDDIAARIWREERQ